jgi:hypothetical protein
MALWPNTRRDIVGFQPTFTPAHTALLQVQQRTWRNVAYFANDTIEETSSVPEGAFQSRACLIAPIIGGGMSSSNNVIDIQFTQSGNVLAGGPMEGDGLITFSQSGGLSLIIGLSGVTAISWNQSGSLSLTIGLSGEVTASMTGTGSLSMLVPLDGAAVATVTGAANLKGFLALAGDITPFTELSPENLATAVWNALLSEYQDAGTAGKALSLASSGGIDYAALAAAILAAAEIDPIAANIKQVNAIDIDGAGTSGDPWGPV